MSVSGFYFDGRSARRHTVALRVEEGCLMVTADGFERSEPLAALKIPAPLGDTPRLVLFADGARCEIPDKTGFDRMLGAAGHDASLLARLEARWAAALGALLVTLACIAAAYYWGLPVAARLAADRMPARAVTLIDEQFLNTFDGRLLTPTKLSTARQQALLSRLGALRWPEGAARPTRVLFRSSALGPNAFALPGGTVVVLDDLVNLADNDNQILGVLAHEIGHVTERHALRQMLQASVVGLAMTWYVGDISTLLAAAPTALLEARYSRDFERRADAFAARTLRLNGISPAELANMLGKLETAVRGQAHADKQAAKGEHWENYLSTHPDTDERIRALRAEP
jgi:Zn-dependent protease with chaperone function